MYGATQLNVILINSKRFRTLRVASLGEPDQWLPVRDQLYYRQAIMCFKCMTGSAPGYLTEQFIKHCDVSKRSPRNAQALDIPLFRSASGQKTFYYQAVSLWNSLTPKLKLCQSQREFKQSLKRVLLTEFLR